MRSRWDIRDPIVRKSTEVIAPDASQIIGTVGPDHLGIGGTHSGLKFLADDGYYKTVTSSATTTTSTVSIVASANVSAFSVITITGLPASSSNLSYYGKVLGVTSADVQSGFATQVTVLGPITNSLWSWTTGAPIFLNGTSLSQTAPSTGFTQEIGIAKASDTIYVDVSVPILL